MSIPPGNSVEGVPSSFKVVIFGTGNRVVVRRPGPGNFSGGVYIGTSDCPSRDCAVEIGEGCTANGLMIRLLEDGSRFEMGRDCMVADDVKVWVSDTHAVTDRTGHVINLGRSVTIGDHVWIGYGARILKNTMLPSGSVVGAGAVVCGTSDAVENCVLAGNPARVVKTDICWHRERPQQMVRMASL